MSYDLISRSALKDAFCEHCDRCFELNIDTDECRNRLCRAMNIIDCASSAEPSVSEHMDAFEAAYRNGYEAAKKESGWIPVWERLPETIPCNAGTEYSEAIVVLTDNNIVLTAVYDGTDFICDASFWEAEGQNITHWKSVLPLPKTPEDGA